MSLASTNDDSTCCRNAASSAGYIKDDYVSYFTKRSKSFPLLNRGTAVRTVALNALIEKFKIKFKTVQIISLGAGFDTRFFNWESHDRSNLFYWEIDVPEVIGKKAMIIKKTDCLYSQLSNANLFNGGFKSDNYNLISGDLNNPSEIKEKLSSFGINFQLPALFLSECCLIYLKVEQCSALIQEFVNMFQNCAFLIYEQV